MRFDSPLPTAVGARYSGDCDDVVFAISAAFGSVRSRADFLMRAISGSVRSIASIHRTSRGRHEPVVRVSRRSRFAAVFFGGAMLLSGMSALAPSEA
ncbi:MAG: hypothetical protein KA144_15205, partial [Xanthomonadaceae bacterium]|nr:hypothetical protein [Xanthomonadaceae bacterium]